MNIHREHNIYIIINDPNKCILITPCNKWGEKMKMQFLGNHGKL